VLRQRRVGKPVSETKNRPAKPGGFVLPKIELGCALNVRADVAFGSSLVVLTVRRMTSGLPRQADDCRAVGGFAFGAIIGLVSAVQPSNYQ
jgi:hypothetical protein